MNSSSEARNQQKAQPATVALFVSDIHLSPELPATTTAFLDFLRKHACRTEQLYLLGDIFEYWAGDDDADDAYHQRIIAALRELADNGVKVYWIAGNRDFLAGESFAAAAGLALLPDPYSLELCGLRMVLTHGDACCTDDTAYMAFRKQVRDAEWQKQFLAKPLVQRKQIVEAMRMSSKEAQRGKTMEIMDVNLQAIHSLFAHSGASVMIHGHTHRPGRHDHEVARKKCVRYVLPDWECEGADQRGGWLALERDGRLQRRDFSGAGLD